MTLTRIEKRLRISGILLIAGLVVELVTLRWSHPTAFIFFLLIGGLLMVAGVLIYLFSLLSSGEAVAGGSSEPATVSGKKPVAEIGKSTD